MSLIRKLLTQKLNKNLLGCVTTFKRQYSDEFILHSDLQDVEIPKVSIDEHLFTKIDKWPQRIATVRQDSLFLLCEHV